MRPRRRLCTLRVPCREARASAGECRTGQVKTDFRSRQKKSLISQFVVAWPYFPRDLAWLIADAESGLPLFYHNNAFTAPVIRTVLHLYACIVSLTFVPLYDRISAVKAGLAAHPIGGVAQRPEQGTHKPLVGGSSPPAATPDGCRLVTTRRQLCFLIAE